MGLNKQKENMYDFVTRTFNIIKGRCGHDCSYCYMKRMTQKELRFDVKETGTNLGEGNHIFVGSSTDVFAPDVPKEWIIDTIRHLQKYPDNTYLLQSKNPLRMLHYIEYLPDDTIFCTTIESNRDYPEIYRNSPNIHTRFAAMTMFKRMEARIMFTIEPILDFDPVELSSKIIPLRPVMVAIGADSGGNRLPEPSKEKILELIYYLEKNNINVVKKKNLGRLLK